MKQRTSAEIRNIFLEFFKEKGHEIEPSVSLVPQNDPTLLWINSGVATLKKYFDGSIVPHNPKIVNAQKAIRTNDIENVGFTKRHHTFFEMLGNFSIGDYFKKEAIEFAWEFLTDEKWIGFDANRLSVTVHPEDEEAYNIWLEDIQLPQERIIRLEENFWDIGQGPSGPNTEIFYDRGESYGVDTDANELYPGGENERYLEVWNLVFSEFNHNADDTYTPLPKQNIDTGMGLERLVSLIQDADTNFDTDLFTPIIQHIAQFTDISYGEGTITDASYKIIADHIRTVAFAIGDHALPSNEGRGYILRRLIRRSVRYAKNLHIEKPFMYQLVPTVASIMESYYPEVKQQADHIMNIIQIEEERFMETLQEGMERLKQIIQQETKLGKTVIPGEEVFKLYDTFGFPKELTEEHVKDFGFTIDEVGFEREMNKQKERARNARKNTGSMKVQDDVLTDIKETSAFIGYDQSIIDTSILYIINEAGLAEKAQSGETVSIILKETPFYAESGGQIADTGILIAAGFRGKVTDVQAAPNGQHIHTVEIEEGTLETNQAVRAEIQQQQRSKITKNHTATHLLHQALRDVLGEHIHQAGSLVTPYRLRFDFTHFQEVTDEELVTIEQIINEKIWENLTVDIQSMPQDEAKELGAMALFGEKYGDTVRVVQIGDYSIELCGGCHAFSSAEIGLFKIVSETGIGAGVRRLEAVTSKEAFELLQEQLNTLSSAAGLLKTSNDSVPERIEKLQEEVRQLHKDKESFQAKLSNQETEELIEKIEEVEGIQKLAAEVKVKDMNQLRQMMDQFKQKIKSGVILLAAENKGKVLLIAGVSEELVQQGFHAGELINRAAKICGGGGGGRPDMAQAGGKDPSKIKEALEITETYILEKTKNK
ncbi:MAG TPA: alanine--tRNA ligase [Pseudogracilibacillus sp.]|nr:alanine--tRNA ligase [Pseudogracilibacillus sp.]